MTVDGHGVSFWNENNVPKLDSGGDCTTANCEYTKTTELYPSKVRIFFL